MTLSTKITIPIDLIRDVVYYLLKYAKDELSCVDPELKPSKKLCSTCPFNPCELVEVERVIKELAVIAVRNNLQLDAVSPKGKAGGC